MKVSYHWLQTFFDAPLPEAQKIRETLTLNAFEVEGLEEKGGDAIFDIAVLPNRGHDALSHRGIAKEIATLFNRRLSRDPLAAAPSLSPDANTLSVTVDDPDACPRYSAAVIRGVSVGPSPDWLRERLESIGQRSINNVVDATNYVMFDMGQPLHAFDMKRMANENGAYAISVRKARQGEKITALDGKEYALSEGQLLIVDASNDTPIGIAGVKGGKPAEISENTEDIIIESANFNGPSIRKTAQALKLRTDASMRFEHELSPELTSYALAEVVDTIVKLAGGTVEGYVDVYPHRQESRIIEVSTEQMNGLLGTALNDGDVQDILKRLGFPYTEKNGVFGVAVPFERLDLAVKEDVIEEIGRVYGYGNISAVLPEVPDKPLEINKGFYYAEKIRDFLIREGFSEVLTYSFVEKGRGDVETANPLAADRPALRRSLETGIMKSLEQNSRNMPLLGLSQVLIFEMGKVFDAKGEHVTLGLGAAILKKGESAKMLETITQKLEEVLGAKLGADISTDTFREFNFEKLIEKLPEPEAYERVPDERDTKYQPFSIYPFVLRDIAIFVPENIKAEEVLAVIQKEAGSLLMNSMLFDEFTPSTGSGQEKKKSYAFRLVYQSMDRTLTDEEVNKIMEKINAAITGRGWHVR